MKHVPRLIGSLTLLVCTACGTDFLFEEEQAPVDTTIEAPTGLVASYGLHMSLVRLTWTPHPDATRYEVYKSNLEEGGAFTMIASNLATPAYDDTNTVASVPFYYKVSYTTAVSNISELSLTAKGMSLPWRAPSPLGITAELSATPGKIRVSFSQGDASAVSYIVYKSKNPTEPFTPAGTTTETSLEVGPLQAGLTHYFRVVGLDAGGIASQVSEAASCAIPPATTLDKPVLTQVSQGSSSTAVSLTWTAVSGATGYNIHRAESADGGYTLLGSQTTTSWNDTTAIAPKTYWYRITAFDLTSTSLPSVAVSGYRGYGTWAGATVVTASDGSSIAGVSVSWLPVPGAARYTVEWATSEGGSYGVLAPDITETTYLDATATAGTKRYYRVLSVRDDGAIGPASTPDCGFRGHEGGPPMPTGVTGVHNIVWTHKVTWNAMAGVPKYRVYIANQYRGPWSQTAEETDTEYSKFNMVDYADYYYRVCCVDGSNREGPWSAPVQSAPNTGVCAPDNITATQGTQKGKIILTWSAARGATKVKLERAPSPEGPWAQIGGDLDSASTGYTDTVTSGVRFYRVYAENLLYTAGRSDSVLGYPAPYPVLDPPGDIGGSNQDGGTKVALSWPEVDQAAGYRVYRSIEEQGMYVDVSGQVSGTTYTDSGLTPGSIYYYKVVTCNQAGISGPLSSPWNNQVRLAAPEAGLASDGTLPNRVAVLWMPVSGADHYRVFRAAGPNEVYLAIGEAIAAGTLQFMDMTPLPGPAWYRIAAYDSAGVEGGFSPADEGFPKPASVPYPPTGLVATKGTLTNGVALSWNPSAETAWYKVARATKIDASYVFISPPLTNTEYLDTSAKGQQYFYKVAAFNNDGLAGLLSSGDNGHRALTDVDFLLAYDTTIASSHTKLTLMHNDGTGALGTEIKNGDISGQVKYEAKLDGLGAKIVFTYINYCDTYLVLNGSYTINAKMDKSGTMSGTVNISSPIYNGKVRSELIVANGNASGGYWYVSQNGNPVETQIAWFPSPSSLAAQ